MEFLLQLMAEFFKAEPAGVENTSEVAMQQIEVMETVPTEESITRSISRSPTVEELNLFTTIQFH